MSGSVFAIGGPVSTPFNVSGVPLSSGLTVGFQVPPGGTIGTGANTTETDLAIWSIPPNVLALDGQAFRLIAYGNFAANVNTKQIRVRFGGSLLFDSAAVAANGEAFRLEVILTRHAPAVQSVMSSFQRAAASAIASAGATENLNVVTNLDLRLTGQNGTAAAGDILLRAARLMLV